MLTALPRSLLIIVLAVPVLAADDPIRVYIYAEAPVGGFRDDDSERLSDSADDIRRALRKTKGMALVDTAEDAEVVIEVVASGYEPTGRRTGTTVITPIGSARSSSAEQHERTVRAAIRIGDYEHEVVGRTGGAGMRWRDAANAAANRIREWLRDNGDRVRGLREDQ